MHRIITIGSWALIILLFLQPGVAHKGAVEGMRIFTTALLPYLLPYLVITQLFIRSQNSFLNTTNKFKLYFKYLFTKCNRWISKWSCNYSIVKRYRYIK